MSFLNSRRKTRKRWNKTGFTWSWPGIVLGEKDMLNLVLTLSFVTLPWFMPKINWIVQKVIVFFPESIAWKVSKYGVFSVPYFPVFGLNTEIFGINLHIQFKCRKIRIRKNSVFGHTPYITQWLALLNLLNITQNHETILHLYYSFMLKLDGNVNLL